MPVSHQHVPLLLSLQALLVRLDFCHGPVDRPIAHETLAKLLQLLVVPQLGILAFLFPVTFSFRSLHAFLLRPALGFLGSLSLAVEAVEVALGDLAEPQACRMDSPRARVAADEVAALEADKAVVVPLLLLVARRLAQIFHQCQRSIAEHVHGQRDGADRLASFKQLHPPRSVQLRGPHATPAPLLHLHVCQQREAFLHLVRLKVLLGPILPHNVP
mmetsp:Transcript_14498/g.49507  ORF Transcript_14498/g.49507 Transcript_14498/m.49507 type:complete len:216 (-) Transcript_14498:1437-2084(-)